MQVILLIFISITFKNISDTCKNASDTFNIYKNYFKNVSNTFSIYRYHLLLKNATNTFEKCKWYF